MTDLPAINIGVPTLSRYDLLSRFCKAFAKEDCPYVIPSITILDNGGKFTGSPEAKALAQEPNLPSISIVTSPYNLGVARSFNWFAANLGACIIAGDDTIISSRTIKAFLDARNDFPDAIIIGHNHPTESLAVMMLAKPDEWLQMGGFDECFYPAYFEDNDARHRLALAGKPIVTIQVPDWHHDNSSTLAASSLEYQRNHWGSFHRNQLYYEKKWGGSPGGEQFSVPFNSRE